MSHFYLIFVKTLLIQRTDFFNRGTLKNNGHKYYTTTVYGVVDLFE
jgi:hypothetical protein